MKRTPYNVEVRPGAPWLLDLFCGAGGASVGYYEAGFNVVGVDNVPQPHYPFLFVQEDAIAFARSLLDGRHWFKAAHASPPCQFASHAQRLARNSHPNYIPATRIALEALCVPYVIENVPDAREHLHDPVTLCGSMFGLQTYRHRLFECNVPLSVPSHPRHVAKQAKMGRPAAPDEFVHVVGNFSGVPRAREAMGISWMTRNELKEAIPPAYTRHIGAQLKEAI